MPSLEVPPRQCLIAMEDVCQSYLMGNQRSCVLDGISFKVQKGESCSIVGASGSGKSTLLNILGLLDEPESGRFILDGHDMISATFDERAKIRNRLIGFVFQSFNLLPLHNALDNVALPLLYRGYSRSEARTHAQFQIERVGLADRLHYRPADLSGGQKQRIAIARALVGEPALILADEPTGNLDGDTAEGIINLLLDLNRHKNVTLIMVTHDTKLAQLLDRQLIVQGGKITESQTPKGKLHGG